MVHHREFFRQFRSQFETTGAIAPSSRFLAKAITGPLLQKQREAGEKPLRVLEVGPGTGAFTRFIVRQLRPQDQFDLVEINENFANVLESSFETDPHWNAVSSQSQLHRSPLQDFECDAPYDVIISGLPLNNFSPDLVASIFEQYWRLLKPTGSLSYFEYMYIRSAKKKLSVKAERERLHRLDEIIAPFLKSQRFKRSWVFMNVPPAWVQHLTAPAEILAPSPTQETES
ncbi:class I SAM-dependent methyltransferase [Polystyrenella longa]|uniref:class I SAM-dependent methyltransferase n=1 Tax=Polystyrenella longa TaxID=2528007 RepID=UPI0018D237A0|nr:methyltransferase domain-containing protein [Polystyrenella longa]